MISEELSGVIGNVAVYEPVFKPESYIESIAQDAHHSAFVDPQCVGDTPGVGVARKSWTRSGAT